MFGLSLEDINEVIEALRRAEPKLISACRYHPTSCKCYVCSSYGLVTDAAFDLTKVRDQLVHQNEPAPF